MPFWRFATVLVLMIGLASGCDNKPAEPPPDRLYSLFERVAEFSVALDRLDVVCGAASPGGRVDWLRDRSAALLDNGQQARLAAFLEDHKEAVFETYRKEYCGMEVTAERDNYIEAYKFHRARLESAIAKFKATE